MTSTVEPSGFTKAIRGSNQRDPSQKSKVTARYFAPNQR
jgi:hypothetical protein